MAESLTLYALGVGDFKPSRHPGHWYPNFMLNMDGREIFVDVPPYTRKMLADFSQRGDQPVEFGQYKEVLITHMHGDHVMGLEELAWEKRYSSEGRIKLYGPGWLLADAWRYLEPSFGISYRGGVGEEGQGSYWPPPGGIEKAKLDWYFEPVETEGERGVTNLGGCKVSSMLTRHIPRTLAFKFDFGNFKLGFSADTGYYPALIRWLDECDLVIHEALFGSFAPGGDAFFGTEENVFSEGDLRAYHTPIADLLKQPESFQRKTLLHHYRDDAYGNDVSDLNYDIGQYELLEQGKVYKLV